MLRLQVLHLHLLDAHLALCFVEQGVHSLHSIIIMQGAPE